MDQAHSENRLNINQNYPPPGQYQQPVNQTQAQYSNYPPPQNQYQQPIFTGQVQVQPQGQLGLSINPMIQPAVVVSGDQTGIYCQVCNQKTSSYNVKGIGTKTYIWAIILCFFTGFFCWIPFVCDACKEDQIKCSQCHTIKLVLNSGI